MGKRKAVVKPKTTPKTSRKGGRARKMPVIRNCAKCLERHEAPMGKKCLRRLDCRWEQSRCRGRLACLCRLPRLNRCRQMRCALQPRGFQLDPPPTSLPPPEAAHWENGVLRRKAIEDSLPTPGDETDYTAGPSEDEEDPEGFESGEVMSTDPESPERPDRRGPVEGEGAMEAFNRVASQLLERSEKKSAELELRLLARDDQARQAQVREEEARRRGREQGGYQPPAAAPDVGLDREARNLLGMTPEDYQFPVPTRVTDIMGHRLPARGAAQPASGDREATSLEASRALERHLGRMTERPGMASPVPSEHATSRLWDAWDMNTRAKLPPPRSEEAAGYPTAREAPVTLPVGGQLT